MSIIYNQHRQWIETLSLFLVLLLKSGRADPESPVPETSFVCSELLQSDNSAVTSQNSCCIWVPFAPLTDYKNSSVWQKPKGSSNFQEMSLPAELSHSESLRTLASKCKDDQPDTASRSAGYQTLGSNWAAGTPVRLQFWYKVAVESDPNAGLTVETVTSSAGPKAVWTSPRLPAMGNGWTAATVIVQDREVYQIRITARNKCFGSVGISGITASISCGNCFLLLNSLNNSTEAGCLDASTPISATTANTPGTTSPTPTESTVTPPTSMTTTPTTTTTTTSTASTTSTTTESTTTTAELTTTTDTTATSTSTTLETTATTPETTTTTIPSTVGTSPTTVTTTTPTTTTQRVYQHPVLTMRVHRYRYDKKCDPWVHANAARCDPRFDITYTWINEEGKTMNHKQLYNAGDDLIEVIFPATIKHTARTQKGSIARVRIVADDDDAVGSDDHIGTFDFAHIVPTEPDSPRLVTSYNNGGEMSVEYTAVF